MTNQQEEKILDIMIQVEELAGEVIEYRGGRNQMGEDTVHAIASFADHDAACNAFDSGLELGTGFAYVETHTIIIQAVA